MSTDVLEPRLDLLRQEYVLVQAWKKTSAYIRYHNWFADTLELDRAAVNLLAFLGSIAEALTSPEEWSSSRLRMVPAPKTQRWRVSAPGVWEPTEKGVNAARLRPLAHVGLRDQVVATALMLCLADRVETLQGDPRKPVRDRGSRRQVVSYGNRLFCDPDGGALRHRWGSAKLYRAYYQDYRAFLSRPEIVAESMQLSNGQRCFIVHSDLRQFYDRVRPDRLAAALRCIQRDGDDASFFDFAERVLNWAWDRRDRSEVAIYAGQAELDDFSRVALPQGLVSAGFFANVALLGFDEKLRSAIGSAIAPGIRLEDACRYVDDLRIVVVARGNEFDGTEGLREVKQVIVRWLQGLLEAAAPGLLVSDDKTKAAQVGGAQRPLVRQSAKMNRIQSAVSGGFDAIGGEEVLDAIQGLMRSQETLSQNLGDDGWALSPLPDVRDETVARFAAARYRTTYRSIRPLLEDDVDLGDDAGPITGQHADAGRRRRVRTQRELDEDARAFSLGLIERWVLDPSNVRLLRVGLDLWPDADVLKDVLNLLRPFTEKGGRRKAPRRVAWYTLSEILRAGATETGLVADQESLPATVDLAAYREALGKEAARLVKLPAAQIPWYLRQQALLFLAAAAPESAPVIRTGRSAETRHYRELIRFLRGDGADVNSPEFATLAVLARRAFSNEVRAVELVVPDLTAARMREIAHRDPSFALELLQSDGYPLPADALSARLREDLCLEIDEGSEGTRTLADVVLNGDRAEPALRNELSILRFAVSFLEQPRDMASEFEVIAPGQIRLNLHTRAGIAKIKNLEIRPSRASSTDSLYCPPSWCDPGDRWRFQLGFLLRFILAAQPDFTRRVRQAHWKESASAYRPAEGHWYQRLYGFFNGQQAFGDDWLPITDWMERFLSALLHWPGCRIPEDFAWIREGIDAALDRIQSRIRLLEGKFGSATGTLFLPMIARLTPVVSTRPLRACVVQAAVPAADDFDVADLTLSDHVIRRRHRNHLSAALAAVERMLDLRETHKGSDGRLDWLILPELAVHPRDVTTHLIPFARAHKTIILAGLTYEELFSGRPLINSALWIIPEWSDAYGLQMRTRRQGKCHLAPSEQAFNSPTVRLQGFRPCQWLVGFPWSSTTDARPLWLTASVCYDATDLRLAADLRKKSDVFAIPALNRDVKTFDQMALALHYHMFQLVIVANNGQYGGSNAYWPSQDALRRQIFHLHGQPQASIAFLEIDHIADFVARHDHAVPSEAEPKPNPGWKYPPAGMI